MTFYVERMGKVMLPPLQVKTTFSYSFRVGMIHGDFIDENGRFDEIKGRKRAEEKVQGPWAFVECDGTESNPEFSFFRPNQTTSY